MWRLVTRNLALGLHGKQALQILATVPVDGVLTDLMMPVMDGIALCCAITTNPTTAHIPVILFSAGKDEVLPPDCHYAAFVRKPFQVPSLLRTLAQVLTIPPQDPAVRGA